MESSRKKNIDDFYTGTVHHFGLRGTGRYRKLSWFIMNKKMAALKTEFRHVRYLWDDARAESMAGDEVALMLYRSNLLGADLRLTNYGGGNTSCKLMAKDPLTGGDLEVMWVKGSGGDLGTLKRSGLSGLYVDRL